MFKALLTLMASLAGAIVLAGPAVAASSCDSRTYNSVSLERGRPVHHHHTYATLLSTTDLRVMKTREDVGAKVYSCWRPNGHVHLLGVDSAGGARATDTILDAFTAVGHHLAFHVLTAGDANADEYVVVAPSTGHTTLKTPAVPAPPAPRPAPQLALSSSGVSLAWLAADGLHESYVGLQTALLADSSHGAITDVASAGQTVYWTQAGRPASAPLR
jgi:hypothetical protein